ncbi:hypothetical protein QQF64_013044 [Cirrhinus molitorella]|uniref:Uncharacterized protein n=1 Tax=Cirrhinus molitorella TaxID=172907 RepID=A0ABR3LQ11_9TELE
MTQTARTMSSMFSHPSLYRWMRRQNKSPLRFLTAGCSNESFEKLSRSGAFGCRNKLTSERTGSSASLNTDKSLACLLLCKTLHVESKDKCKRCIHLRCRH